MDEALGSHPRVTLWDYEGLDHGFANAQFGKRRDEAAAIPRTADIGLLRRASGVSNTWRMIFRRTGRPEADRARGGCAPHPGSGRARIRHEAIGVTLIDTYHRGGLLSPASALFGAWRWSEAAGIVEAVGEGVDSSLVGRRRVAYVVQGKCRAPMRTHGTQRRRRGSIPCPMRSARRRPQQRCSRG